jgi:hypothetical protein
MKKEVKYHMKEMEEAQCGVIDAHVTWEFSPTKLEKIT